LKRITNSLFKKAFIALVAALLPFIVAFIYNYQSNKAFLKSSSLNALTAIAEAYEGQVYQFLELSRRRAQDFSSDGFIVSSLKRIESGDTSVVKPLSAHLKRNKLSLDKTIDRIYLIDGAGRVVAATNETGAGRDASAEPFFREGRRAVTFQERKAPSGRPELAVAAPIRDNSTGRMLGVIVNFIEFTELNNVLSGELSKELGAVSWQKGRQKTMEIYLVNKDMLMVGESVSVGGKMLSQTVDTEAVKACAERQEEVSGFYTGYRGTTVAGASMCLPMMRWTLIVEVAEEEVFAPLGSMKKSAVVAAVIVMGIAGALYFAFYKGVVARLLALGEAAARVARGEYDIIVPVISIDEIGALAESFNRMASEVKRREVIISQSEERLRAIIDNSTAIIYLKGLDGGYKLVNRQYEKLSGLPHGKIIGMTDYEIFPPEQASVMRANDMQVVQAGEAREFEEMVTQSDGIHYYISVKVPLFDAFGAPFAVCGISTDITERKRMESEQRLVQTVSEALSESRDFTDALAVTVRKVCEVTGWGFGEAWIPNADESGLSLKYCSLCGAGRMDECRLHGSTEGLTLRPGMGLPGRVWAAKTVELVRDVAVDGDVFIRASAALEQGLRSCVGMPVVSDGRVMAVIVFFMPRVGALEENYVKMLTEVSPQFGAMLGRRLAEVGRREVMRRYEELVNNLSVGVYRSLPGPDNRLVEANRAVIDIFEAGSREEMLSHRLLEFCRDTARCMEIEEELMRQGRVRDAEIEFVTFKGKPLRVSVTAVKKEDSDGNVYFDGIMVDVSEKRLLEEQFRHSQKLEAVGRLASGMAHDFNNILTAIIGYANLLKMKSGGNETTSSFAEHILTLSESAAALTQGLLAFSRKRSLSLQPVDINGLVARTSKMLARLIGEDIEIRINRAEGEFMVMADSAQMEQVLMNLATNASDAMPGGGTLMITTSSVEIDREFVSSHGYGTPGPFAQIIFEDTGTGMDKETCEHIFEPFFTTKEVGKGTGLGLAMVYGTIKQHDGFINVYSEPGSGATFRIYLPLIAAASKLSAPVMDEPDESCRGHETILLAEDQPDVREITKRLLEEFGYRVIEAANGEDALERFKEEDGAIDLLMLDMKMPKKGGSETYEEIKKIKYDIKVIFMSGYSEEIMQLKDKGMKAFDFYPNRRPPSGCSVRSGRRWTDDGERPVYTRGRR